MKVFYTTSTGGPDGMASSLTENKEEAAKTAEAQNKKAQDLGIPAGYAVGEGEGVKGTKGLRLK